MGNVVGPDCQLTGHRTVPFLQTEETHRPGSNAPLGPSSRFIGAKVYQNEYLFRFPDETRSFGQDFEKAIDANGDVVWIDRNKRERGLAFANGNIAKIKRENRSEELNQKQQAYIKLILPISLL